MSADEEKKFVMKHVFNDVKNLKNNARHYENEETHFNITWKIYIYTLNSSTKADVKLQCLQCEKKGEWSIDTKIETKILTNEQETVVTDHIFSKDKTRKNMAKIDFREENLINGRNLSVEIHVTINQMTGIKVSGIMDESKKKFSDVVLVVKDQKFYVSKLFLSYHSAYFEALFMGNFDESKQAEVQLKDIDAWEFQKFLEVLYGEPDINEKTVQGILRLADMYDAKAVIQQCEKFLVNNSKLNLKEKFLLAVQYKLEGLKKKCMPEFKTSEDIAAVIPENAAQMDPIVWKELLKLSLEFNKKLAGK